MTSDVGKTVQSNFGRIDVRDDQRHRKSIEEIHSSNPQDVDHSKDCWLSRREMLGLSLLGASAWLATPDPTGAVVVDASSTPNGGVGVVLPATSAELPTGLLESRVSENVLSKPPYGMESPDIYYPSWFTGTWNIKSSTANIEAPCGIGLFGGNATYVNARREIGTALLYQSRFVPTKISATAEIVGDGNGNGVDGAIADRAFNVESIAKAAMGNNSVLDMPVSTPNKFTCILAPLGSPSLIKADLITLNRRSERISDVRFDCSEVVRQIIAPINSNNNKPNTYGAPAPSRIKEIETTSIYTYNAAKDIIECRQRSATYLVPSQEDPIALQMWQASRGRPIDVRFYDMVYTRR